MKQEIVIGMSLSTAIYVQIFFIKHGYYPLIYIEKGRKNNYFPNWVNPDIFIFLKKILPGIEKHFGQANWSYINNQLIQEKYVSLPSIAEFLYSFFHSKGIVSNYSKFEYSISQNTLELEFLLEDNEPIIWNYCSIVTYQSNTLNQLQDKILYGKTCEIFSFDASFFLGGENAVYEHMDTEENMLYLVGSLSGRLYLSIDYISGKREESIRRFFELFSQYLHSSFTYDFLRLEQGHMINLMIDICSPIAQNVKLLGNALGYLPPTHNFGLRFSIFDAYNTIYYSYKEVFLYRIKLYQILKYIYKRDGKIEKDPLLDMFVADNIHFSLFSIEKSLGI